MRTIIPRVLLFMSLLLLIFPLFALAQSATTAPPIQPTTIPTQTVTPTPFPTPLPVGTLTTPQEIKIGDTVTQTFPSLTTSAIYYFEGSAGQYVSISAAIQLSATKLRLLDPNYLDLARGTFNNAARGVEITAVKLPQDGIYTSNVNSIGEKKTEHQWQKDSARHASRRDW